MPPLLLSFYSRRDTSLAYLSSTINNRAAASCHSPTRTRIAHLYLPRDLFCAQYKKKMSDYYSGSRSMDKLLRKLAPDALTHSVEGNRS